MSTTANTGEQLPGLFLPKIDRNRCEGKAACVQVCPYDVLNVEKITKSQRAELSFVGKIKAFAHRGMQAQIVAPDACHACSECVKVCPEQAITLERRGRQSEFQ